MLHPNSMQLTSQPSVPRVKVKSSLCFYVKTRYLKDLISLINGGIYVTLQNYILFIWAKKLV